MGPDEGGAQQAGPWNFVRDGAEAFADPNHIVTENYHFEDEREQRYLAIGMTKAGAGGCSIRRSQRAGSRDHSHHFSKKGGGV